MLATFGSIQNRPTYTGGQLVEYGLKICFYMLKYKLSIENVKNLGFLLPTA
jgi:hypothetical protein